jgi:hypothetical protein
MTISGYALGNMVPNLDERIHIVVAVVIVLSLIPAVVPWARAWYAGRSRIADRGSGIRDQELSRPDPGSRSPDP